MRNTRVKGNRRNGKTIVKVNTRNIIELLIGRIVLDIILGIIATGLVLGIFWVIGGIVWLCETYIIASIILFIIGGISVIKLVNEAE